MALLTTTVGWFPKSVELRRARWRFAEGEIEEAELRRAEESSMRDVVQLQEAMGIHVLVDGQMDRGDMVSYFADRLEGMEAAGLVRCFGNRYYRKPRIIGPIGRPGPITIERWKAAQGLTAKPIKAILTGPYTLMDWSFDEHYGSRERACMALAEGVRAEAQELLAAGATEIEIDEPAISARPEETALAAEALGRVTAPLRGKARTWTHICYGQLLPLIEQLFALPVDGLLLELSHAGDDLLEALSDLPADKLLGAGVIDVQSPVVEEAEAVRARVERLLRRVPADRLWLAPDAALRTLSAEQAEAKLRSMIEGGRQALGS